MLGDTVDAGIVVNRETAMEISAVFACVSRLAEAVGIVPFKLFRKDTSGRRLDISWTREGKLFRRGVNGYQTWQDFANQAMLQLLIYGDFRAKIGRVNDYVDALYPIDDPQNWRTEIVCGEKKHYHKSAAGDDEITYKAADIFHIAGASPDGYTGRAMCDTHRQTLSLARAVGQYGCKFFANSGTPAGVLIVPNLHANLQDDETVEKRAESIRKTFTAAYGGGNTHRIMVSDDMKYESFGVDPDKAQALETRQQVTKEIAAIFNMPMWKLYQETPPNAEARNSFYTDCLMPHLVRLQSNIDKQLLPDNCYCKFIIAALLQADQKSRYDSYRTAIQSRILCPNEARAMEELEPYDGGELYINPNVMSQYDAERLAKREENAK